MSLLVDAIQPFIRPGFVSVREIKNTLTFSELIIGPKASFNLTFDDSDESILLDFRDSEFLLVGLASDCCRFSSAAFQTVGTIEKEVLSRDHMAWAMLKLYYAAFYSGHVILRLLGESSSFFDDRHTDRFKKMFAATGLSPSFDLSGGLYKCVLDASSSKLKCNKAGKGSIGSGHELFWKHFGEKINLVANDILKGPLVESDRNIVFSRLESFREILKRSKSYNWLSYIRNELQYRHKFDLWYPSGMNKKQSQILSGIIKNWMHDPMNIDCREKRVELWGEFVAICLIARFLFYPAFITRRHEGPPNRSTTKRVRQPDHIAQVRHAHHQHHRSYRHHP